MGIHNACLVLFTKGSALTTQTSPSVSATGRSTVERMTSMEVSDLSVAASVCISLNQHELNKWDISENLFCCVL